MRIVHATDTFGPTVGGIEVLVHDLSARQAAAGHDVTVLTRTPGPRSTGPVTVCRDPQRIGELVRQADVVHAHVSAYSPLALRTAEAAAARRVPAVVAVHSMWASGWPVARAADALRGWADTPIQWAAVSEAAAGPVRRALPGRSVVVLPNAVDVSAWSAQPRLALPGEGTPHVVTFVTVMRMTRRKRPLALVQALRRMRERLSPDVPVRAVLVGDGPMRPAVLRAVARHGMGSWVSVPGALDHEEIKALYRGADVFVSPATLESFGIAALEARASGLAVVARTGTGVGDFVKDGQDGLLVGSDDEMVAALLRLCADPDLTGAIRAHNTTNRPAFDWSDVLWRNAYAYELATELVGRRVPRVPQALLGPVRPESPA